MTHEKLMRPEEIAGVMSLSYPYRVRTLLGCCKITFAQIARKHNCDPSLITQCFSTHANYKAKSLPVWEVTYSLLQRALGPDTPAFNDLFGIEQIKQEELEAGNE